MGISRHHILTIALGLALWSAGSEFLLYAQSDRLHSIDSLMNPLEDSTGICLRFDRKSIGTGTIREDGNPASYTFRWQNTGEKAMTVLRVTTTCGCVVPKFERTPVLPGKGDSLTVTYYPKGHPGKFNRKIMVYTDLSGTRPAAVLELKGYVEPAAKPTWNYPFAFGNLMLKRKEVKIDGDKIQTERILCMNAGDVPLTISADAGLLPSCLGVRCEPETIPPGGEADIIIRFRPEAGKTVPGQIPVVLEGIALPPSQRTLKIIIQPEK